MKLNKLLLSLCLALCLAAVPALAEERVYGGLGEPMPDFTVTTISGETFTLSGALAEKDMVLINLWATWCGPCRMEFPYLQEAYERYRDRVEVIALSVEPTDTDAALADFAAEYGLTFPIANEGDLGLGAAFATVGIPTSLVVDRFGNVAFIEVGSQPSADAFTRLFDVFVGEDYTESLALTTLPPERPSVAMPSEDALSAVANAEGGALVFRNAPDPYTWPMTPSWVGDRDVLVSSNSGVDNSTASALTTVTAAEGDALAFDFFTSTEAACDLLVIAVDGETVKVFGGEHDWTAWAIALPAGEHEVSFSYVKDHYEAAGVDWALVDNVRLVSGAEAAALLAALPAYPVADEFTLTARGEGIREIVFDDPDDMLYDSFACGSYWIAPSGRGEAQATVTAGIDPEAAFFYSDYDGAQTALADALGEEGYIAATDLDSMGATGYSYTGLYLYPYADVASADELLGVMFFLDEANVNAFVEDFAASGYALSWRYADGDAPVSGDAAEGASPLSEYTVSFVDQEGNPVPGCVVNFCTEETCQPCVADENGAATFAGLPYAYHLQVIRVPEGYEFDTAQEFYAEAEGGELTFTVTKK